MKKSILACALLVGVLAGCSSVVPDETMIEDSTVESTVEIITEDTALTDNSSETTLNETIADNEYSWQLQVLFDNKDTWERSADHPFAETNEMVEDWYFDYAVTDLDSDGYLELLKVASFNNGPVTKVMLFEVTEDGDLEELEYEYKGPVTNMSDCPDLMIIPYDDPFEFYRDDIGNKYICRNIVSYGLSGGAQHYYGLLSLVDNSLVFEVLFWYKGVPDEAGEVTYSYFDAEGNEISEDAYDQLLNDYESSSTDEIYLCWFNEVSLSNLENSYMMFTGE